MCVCVSVCIDVCVCVCEVVLIFWKGGVGGIWSYGDLGCWCVCVCVGLLGSRKADEVAEVRTAREYGWVGGRGCLLPTVKESAF